MPEASKNAALERAVLRSGTGGINLATPPVGLALDGFRGKRYNAASDGKLLWAVL